MRDRARVARVAADKPHLTSSLAAWPAALEHEAHQRGTGGGRRSSISRTRVEASPSSTARPCSSPDALPGERVVLRRVASAAAISTRPCSSRCCAPARTVCRRVPAFRPMRRLRAAAPRARRAARVQAVAAAREPGAARRRRAGQRARTARRARSGAIAGARGSASSSCHARDACWSAFANARRPTWPTCTSAACWRAPVGTLIDPLAALVAGLSIAARVPAGRGRGGRRRLRAGAARARSADRGRSRSAARLRTRARGAHSTCSRAASRRCGRSTAGRAAPLQLRARRRSTCSSSSSPPISSRSTARSTSAMVAARVELLELEPARRRARPVLRARQFLAAARDPRPARSSASRATRASSHRARANAARNGIAQRRFHVADLFADVERRRRGRSVHYDSVLLDPPRAGAREILPVVGGCGAAASCIFPATRAAWRATQGCWSGSTASASRRRV